MKIQLPEVCKEIFAGGDVPKDRFSKEKTDLFNVPIYANAEQDDGLYGYTDKARVYEESITIAARGTIGYTSIRKEPFLPVVRLITVIPNNKKVDTTYLYYALRHLKPKSSGTSIPQLTVPTIKSYSFNYADSIDEQKRIVARLSLLERIIRDRTIELNLLDELIKARFVEMFGSIYEDRFPKCKLKEVAHIKHGYAFSGEFFSDEDNGIVLVTPGNFAIGGGFQEIKNRYYTSDYSEEYVLHPGDLIVTMTDLSKKADTLGYGAIVPDTDKVYLHNQRIGLFDKLDEKLNPVFVRWYMQTDEYRLEIVRTSTGSTVHHTSPDRILNSTIYLPPIETQILFAQFAKQVDKSKVAIQKSLDKTKLLFESLMQEYYG